MAGYKIEVTDKYGNKSWYRKQGTYCYDLVNDERCASVLDEREALKVYATKPYILKQYGAVEMELRRA